LLLARRACAKQESGRMTEAAAQEISAGLRAGIGSDRPAGRSFKPEAAFVVKALSRLGRAGVAFLKDMEFVAVPGLWLGGLVALWRYLSAYACG
jgi:hypothetical protein